MHPRSTNIVRVESHVTRAQRRSALGHDGATVWFTGLSGSGKSTLAYAVEAALLDRTVAAYVLDGDNIRHGLNRDLGFSPEDRAENIRRAGEVCRLFCAAGIVTLTAFISPYRRDRHQVRSLHPDRHFIEVHLDPPLDVCEARDPKGLYAKARTGEIADFSGVSAPYEAPERAELRLDTSRRPLAACVEDVLAQLHTRHIID
jgi:adenylylsulfate kinase